MPTISERAKARVEFFVQLLAGKVVDSYMTEGRSMRDPSVGDNVALLEHYARAADPPDPKLLFRWVRIRAIITSAQRAESADPTADSARWDASLQALARLVESASL